MAIVSRITVEEAQSVKETVRRSLTRRLISPVNHDAASSTPSNSGESDHGLDEADNVSKSGDEGKKTKRVKKTRFKIARNKRRKADAREEDLESGDINKRSGIVNQRRSRIKQANPAPRVILLQASCKEVLERRASQQMLL